MGSGRWALCITRMSVLLALVADPTEMQRQQRVHSDRFNARTTTESEFGGGLRIEKKRVVVDGASGVPRRSKPSGEGALEPTMGRKRHVDPSDLTSLRNGWGVSTLGDKPYASPEYVGMAWAWLGWALG